MYKLLIAVPLIALAGAIAFRGEKTRDPGGGDEVISIYNAALDQDEFVRKVRRTESEWMKLLTPEQYRVTRMKGTEPPGTCPAGEVKEGMYQCVGCGTDLFKYDRKFESGTGWPSFWAPVSELNVRYESDTAHGMVRTEVMCARCDAHLGHVFDDGPEPTGKRFCINGVALRLAPLPEGRLQKAAFATGCFWGTESAFRKLLDKGVVSTRVGYTGGTVKAPSYELVCTGQTGHMEAVEVVFDPAKVSYEELLGIFWESHNPYRSDGQGPDIGSQYRAAVFYHSPEQKKLAEESRAALQKKSGRPVATMIVEAKEFYPAEEYHQQYFEKTGAAHSCPVY